MGLLKYTGLSVLPATQHSLHTESPSPQFTKQLEFPMFMGIKQESSKGKLKLLRGNTSYQINRQIFSGGDFCNPVKT